MMKADSRSDRPTASGGKSLVLSLVKALLMAVVAGAVVGAVMLVGINWTGNGSLPVFGLESDAR